MNKKYFAFFATLILLPAFYLLFSGNSDSPNTEEWGFYGHRRINRMAVFTLPPEMIGFYKKNIEYITDHAVDPDKRRYATKHEAVRHYIDIDHWDEYPFEKVPRDWTQALVQYTNIYMVTDQNDTLHLLGTDAIEIGKHDIRLTKNLDKVFGKKNVLVRAGDYQEFFKKYIQSQYYEDEWIVDCEVFTELLRFHPMKPTCTQIFAEDTFSEYGILPFHLEAMYYKLVKSFRDKDVAKILRNSAEFGHYIGDASVPLHTTENYNGQMTNQVGIHAFWESRLPELFAEEEFDFFVGRSEYIEDVNEFFWDMVLTSHSHLDSVLLIEKDLSQNFASDKQFCYEQRVDRTIRTQCKDYSKAYFDRLDGMVEQQMCSAIKSIGSVWYSAWVDAGQPDLKPLMEKAEVITKAEKEKLEKLYKSGKTKGRGHGE